MNAKQDKINLFSVGLLILQTALRVVFLSILKNPRSILIKNLYPNLNKLRKTFRFEQLKHYYNNIQSLHNESA